MKIPPTARILSVDLDSGRHSRQEIAAIDQERYLGGRGLGIKIMGDLLPQAGVDPLSAENPLTFWPGPLSGLPIAGPCRVSVVTKAANTSPLQPLSPHASSLTYSQLGGHFGPALKQAGHDGLIITGRASRPVYLRIDDDRIALEDAADLWGLTTSATLDRLSRKLGPEYRFLLIGPAGENRVRFAGIVSDVKRTTARGGAGAVMGSKNLKAIAVRGTLPLQPHNPQGVFALRRELTALLSAWGNYTQWRRWGATPLLASAHQAGMLAVRNYREGSWESVYQLGIPAAEQDFWVKHSACAYCPLKCIKTGQISNGPWRGTIAEGPGYSAGAMLGSNCGVQDLPGLMQLMARADDLGLDAISAGNVLGFSLELAEHGLLKKSDLDGLSLAWGHVPTLLQLMERIARRQGIGEILAGGVKKAADQIGSAAVPLAMHVKGQELAGWNIPASHDFALVYGTANRGASHQEGATIAEQHRRTFMDSLCVCRFVYGAVGSAPFQKALQLATGRQYDDASLQKVGERIWNREKLFNAREGFRRADDLIPRRFAEIRFSQGPKKGAAFPADKQDQILDQYYEARGWDKQTSLPKPEKLKALDLDKLV